MTEYSVLADAYRKISEDAQNGAVAVGTIVKRLAADLSASVLIADANGCIAAAERQDLFNPFDKNTGERLDGVLTDSLLDLHRDLINVPMDELPVRTAAKSEIRQYSISVFPIRAFGRRTGSLLVYKKGAAFREAERALCVGALTMAGLIMAAVADENRLAEERKRETVRVVTDSLSYSELMVSGIIFRLLKGGEGIIVASRIADEQGITRSVIVNAIRKLESAGVLESRSLGMKGTYIKVLNDYFGSEVAKINVKN